MKQIIVIGSTAQAAQAALEARQIDAEARIVILSDENTLPYESLKLLELLEGKIKERSLPCHGADFYAEHRLELVLNSAIESVGWARHRVTLKDKDRQPIGFDEIINAAGERFVKPAMKGAQKEGVVAPNTLADFKFLMDNLPIAHTVVIVGDSPMANALVRVIAARKIEIKYFGNLSEPVDGVDIIVDNPMIEILGEGEVKAVRLANHKVIGASLVIFAGPRTPAIDISKDTPGGDNMSDIKTMVTGTTAKLIDAASDALESAIKTQGPDAALGFQGTAFFLPLAYALLGCEVKNLADARAIIAQAKLLGAGSPTSNGIDVKVLDGLLGQGLATLFAEELLAVLTHKPQEGYLGFIPDTVLRSLGVQLVDGRIAGIAVVLGSAKDTPTAVSIIRELQSKSIVCLLVGNAGQKNIRDQLVEGNVELGLDNYIVPLGPDELSSIYAVNFAIRAALSFGALKGGQAKEIFTYCQNRVSAFVMVLGKLDEVIATTGLGVLNFGFPIITDQDAPQIPKIETTRYEAIVIEKDSAKIGARAIETRGIKVKVASVPIPVLFGPAFEGERVRKENLRVEFGGKYSTAFEFLASQSMDNVKDGMVTVVGPDIDAANEKAMPLGIFVEVAARNFNKDFEPILERQIHHYLNQAQGVMHMGQRDMIWLRISQEAFAKGLRLKHVGLIIHAMIHKDFGAIVDKVQVTLLTKPEDISRHLESARLVFEARDERLAGMTDESVATFYSCALCQSFAPNHLCIITPERLGLCGAYSWLDAKAAHEITPSGGNQPIEKGACLEPVTGQWKNINEFIHEKSNKTIQEVSMYSLLVSPQSSCGCFECIVALVPEVNGVLVVSRDYPGATPLGMNFTQLAGSVGGGVQTPGFIGVGKLYLTSKKFISAEGGLKRLVWMPKDLKDALRVRLEVRANEEGLEGFVDKIADETTAETIDELVAFLREKKHPVLDMAPLI